MKKNNYLTLICRSFASLFFGIFSFYVQAQSPYIIEGGVTDQNGQPVPYANIAICDLPDSLLVGGTISDEEGNFTFRHHVTGPFLVTASFIGYAPGSATIKADDITTGDVSNAPRLDAGTLVLQQMRTAIDEVVIRKSRVKAKQQVDHTTYYVNSSMQSASQSGIQLMNLVPGVQVNLFNEISLDGSTAIVILVNGMKRDVDYLGQLDADRIDRVEIQPYGGMRYGAEVSGVINVILKETKQKGISGHLYANVPTKSNEVFSFPSASISYTSDKTTLYTSYNGGFSYFSIEGENRRTVRGGDGPTVMIRTSELEQKNWSHKVHFGMDRFSNEKNQLSLYGFLSGFSNEQDGLIEIAKTGHTDPFVNTLIKDDSDRNNSAYTSIYYRHRFNPGSALILEGSYYRLRSTTGTELWSMDNTNLLLSGAEPVKDEINSRAVFTYAIAEHMTMEAGLQYRVTSMQDNQLASFRYTDHILAGYIQGMYNGQRVDANGGLRVEHSRVMYSDVLDRTKISLLPRLDLKYSLNPGENLVASYRKRVDRPDIFQLNPSPFSQDPYIIQKGNPRLVSEVRHDLSVMYSHSFRENFISAGLFYKYDRGIIEDLTSLNGLESFLAEKQNLGNLSHAGVKVLGSINLNERISLSPHFEISRVQTRANALARSQGITDRTRLGIRGKMSAVWSVRDDLSLSSSVQFQSATLGIQRDYSEGVLYFLNIDKEFFDRLNLGITSAIPIMRSFTYQAYEIASSDFAITSEDNIRMSMIPVWFKLKYSFSSGIRTRQVERDKMFEENRVKKGF